jgi:hypothetical protein
MIPRKGERVVGCENSPACANARLSISLRDSQVKSGYDCIKKFFDFLSHGDFVG